MSIYHTLNKSLCEIFDVEYNPNEVYGEPNIIPFKRNEIPSWNKGMVLSDEHKQAISESRIGEKNPMFGVKHSEEYKQKMSESMLGKNTESKTYEHRLKISKTLRGRKPIWKKVECPHCGKKSGENVAYRWHFNNCKSVVSVQQTG